jgi:hypothetical protein
MTKMKTFAKITGAIRVCLVLALVALRITGFSPLDSTSERIQEEALSERTFLIRSVSHWSVQAIQDPAADRCGHWGHQALAQGPFQHRDALGTSAWSGSR